MLDIRFIRENRDLVKKAAADKNVEVDIDRLLSLDEEKRRLIVHVDEYRRKRNEISEEVGKETDDGERQAAVRKAQTLKEESEGLEKKLKEVTEQFGELLLLVPNVYSPDSPVGGAELNREVHRFREPPQFDFPAKDHVELGRTLDIIDFEAGAKVSGYRGYYLKNEAVFLHLGIIWHAAKKMAEKGFKPFIPPTLVKEFALVGSGHLPAFKEDIYGIAGEKVFLAGTSEPSLLAFYSDKVFKEEELPIKVFGVSPCYRSEIGSYGKDTRGVFRVHEFVKVEQVVLCRGDLKESEKHFKELLGIAREILEELSLPYRVMEIATGEMGAGKYRMQDIETFMPSRGYSETHSNSMLTDWHARRLNIRYKDKSGKTNYVHTLNNTAIASPRILIAVLENNQRKDCSVAVPEVLREYVGKDVIYPRI